MTILAMSPGAGEQHDDRHHGRRRQGGEHVHHRLDQPADGLQPTEQDGRAGSSGTPATAKPSKARISV